MRFHGEHIGTVLPSLFVKDECNEKFIEEQILVTQMGSIFDDAIVDNYFDRLYNEVSIFDLKEEFMKDKQNVFTEEPSIENIITKEPDPKRYSIPQSGILMS